MLVIASYTAAVCVKQGGVPASISATFYKLAHPYWFMAAMWLTAGLLMPALLEASKEGTEWMAFLGCAGMLLVGAAPHFKEDLEGKVHTAGAVLCLVASQVWVGFNCPWCLAVWVAYVAYTIAGMAKHVTASMVSDFLWTKPMFWIEVTAFVSTYISVFILL